MSKDLSDYGYNKYSQDGEDGIIERIFKLLPSQKDRWCVEFGAWDGKHLSNTYKLFAEEQWNAILIEGNDGKFEALRNNCEQFEKVVLMHEFVGFEGPNSLDNLLARTAIPQAFDLLSIDIDSNDYHVWDSLVNYHPRVVIIEFNPTIPSDIEFVQERKPGVYQGASLLSLVKMAKSKGYELVAATHCNGFFIRKDLYQILNVGENDIEKLWKSQKPAPRLFQLYDGTMVLTEEVPLYWGDGKIGRFDLQSLPPKKRKYKYGVDNSLTQQIKRKLKQMKPLKNKR